MWFRSGDRPCAFRRRRLHRDLACPQAECISRSRSARRKCLDCRSRRVSAGALLPGRLLRPAVTAHSAARMDRQVLPSMSLAMAENTHGELLLLTPAGLVRIVGGKAQSSRTSIVACECGELPKVRSLLVDREGNLWVGMIGTGLVRLRPAPLTAYGKEEGLSDSSFNTVFQDREGRIWLGGDLALLVRWASVSSGSGRGRH